MPSIIDSFREIHNDRFSFFKIFILTIPVYFSYHSYLQKEKYIIGLWEILILFLILGLLIKVANNVINERNEILPPLNPFKLIISSLKCIVAIAPVTCIFCLLAVNLCSKIVLVGWFNVMLQVIVWLIALSASLTSFLMFSAKEKILDAYNLKLFIQNAGDLLVTIIFVILQLLIVNIFTSVFMSYVLFILFGEGLILDFFILFAIVFNIAVIGHVLGQTYFGLFGFAQEK